MSEFDAIADEQAEDEVLGERPIEELMDEWSAKGAFQPGNLIDDMPDRLYHRGPGCSKSTLDYYGLRTPAHHQFDRLHPRPDTRATRVGRAFHSLLLTPHEFPSQFVASQFEEFRTKEAKAWKAAVEAQGLFVLGIKAGKDPARDPSEWDMIQRMRDAVMSHPLARCFFSGYTAERSGFWTEEALIHEGIFAERFPGHGHDGPREYIRHELAKFRIDLDDWANGFMVDIKTTEDASKHEFGRSAAKYRYHVQDRWYMRGQRALGLNRDAFLFLVVEKSPPWGVAIYRITQEWLHQADRLIDRDLAYYSLCRERGEWPSYPVDPRDLELPRYAAAVPIV